MPEISVIVPVYNVEKYLSECIESVLAQTFSNFELILVDDGSTDSSGDICDSYAKRDLRIKVIHKANGGVSSARNVGINASNGKYITFIDSDDAVDKDFFKIADQEINSRDIDVYISGLSMETWQDEEIISTQKYGIANAGQYSIKKLLDNLEIGYPLICICGPWCKLFRSEIIKKNSIKFDTSMSLGVDTNFNMDVFLKCRYVYFSNRCFYRYRRGNSNSLFSKFHKDTFEVHKKIYDKMYFLVRQKGCDPMTIERYRTMTFSLYLGCVHAYYRFFTRTTHLERYELVRKIGAEDIIQSMKLRNQKGKNKLFLFLLKNNFYNLFGGADKKLDSCTS